MEFRVEYLKFYQAVSKVESKFKQNYSSANLERILVIRTDGFLRLEKFVFRFRIKSKIVFRLALNPPSSVTS